jgi:hypothetical protein
MLNDIDKTILHSYLNGTSYMVVLYDDGTKVRYHINEDDVISQPETIDVKITNYCDLGCEYCHEISTTKGKHGDLDALSRVLEPLKAGTELAIGGGNPLDHPSLAAFLGRSVAQGLICNLTINQGHIIRAYKKFRAGDYDEMYILNKATKLCKAVGVSITDPDQLDYVVRYRNDFPNAQIVIHVIAGIDDSSILRKLHEHGLNHVLILGYKQFGLGKNYGVIHSEEVRNKILDMKVYMPLYFDKLMLSFDNLGIEQLNPQRFFMKNFNDIHYMGDDFTFSMYVDAVKMEYAPTSRAEYQDRVRWDQMDILEFFQGRRVRLTNKTA